MLKNFVPFALFFIFNTFFFILSQFIEKNTQLPENHISIEPVKIQVLNGNGIKEAANQMKIKLRNTDKNIDVLDYGNYDRFDFPFTLIIDRKNNKKNTEILKRLCNTKHSLTLLDESIYDITIILGKN